MITLEHTGSPYSVAAVCLLTQPPEGALPVLGLSDGNVVMVSIGEEIESYKLAADSATVKNWKRKRAADMKVEEVKKEAQLAKAAAKKAEAK